jgi:hypothetical protein
MRRGLLLGLLFGLIAAPTTRADVKPSPSHRAPRLDAVVLLIRHRVFHDFRDEQRVKLDQEFVIGDTEFTGRVVRYVPDFAMDLSAHKVFSRTPYPNNPAFQIIVRKSKVPQDTTWALLHMPPHFARNSLLAFQAIRIDFRDRSPLYPDTTSARPPSPQGKHS